jgi:ubiquinone/menaquinone biosynthesis C-methylase UbiE
MKYQKDEIASLWDKVSLNYDARQYWNGLENRANYEELLLHIGDPAGKRIIEVGSGSGFTSLALAQQGAHIALLDLSSEALKVAEAAFVQAGLPPPELFNQDALKSAVPSDSFDVVWNGGVIEHFFDPGKEILIKEMLRMAKPGGKVIIIVPSGACWEFQLVQAWLKLRKTWIYGFEDDMSPRRLRRMCERLGIANSTVYAFNTVLGWRWLPKIGRHLTRWLGMETMEHHRRRSWMGFITILVIEKGKA